MLRETLAPANRRGGGLVATLHVFRGLVRDRPFMGYALSAGLAFAAMATYISGSPFVLQDIHGVSPQLFSVIFASNAIGIMAASQVSRALVGRYGPRAMLDAGVCDRARRAASACSSPWWPTSGSPRCSPASS